MAKKLEGYLHYYMGATFWTDNSQGEVNPETLRFIYPMIEKKKGVQLHLRRLADMTEEEKTEIARLYGWFEGKKIINEHHLEIAHESLKELAYDSLVTANEEGGDDDRLGPQAYFNILPYLLIRQFDLFGLIDAGLAVDAKAVQS